MKHFCFVLVGWLAASAAGHGQVIQWREPLMLEPGTGSPSLPEIAVSGDRIVTVWRHWLGGQRIETAMSLNGGESWSAPRALDGGTGLCNWPHFAMCGNRAAAVWTQQEGKTNFIGFSSSADGGITWPQLHRLSLGADAVDHPRVAVADSQISAVWVQVDGGVKTITSRCSYDGGATWEEPQNISTGRVNVADPCLAVESNRLAVVWAQDDGHGVHLWASVSVDGGNHWLATQAVEQNPGRNFSGESWAFYPQVTLMGSNILATWCQSGPGGTCAFVSRSTDDGRTWSKARVLREGGASSFPRIVSSGTNAVAVWIQPDHFTYAVMSSGSSDGGETWSPPQSLVSGSRPADNPEVAMDGLQVRVVWRQHDGTALSVFSNVSTDGGKTWQGAQQLEANSGMGWYPQVAVSGEKSAAIWMQQAGTSGWSVFVNHSDGAGQPWQSPGLVANGSEQAREPVVALSGEKAAMLWSQLSNGHWQLAGASSTNGGGNWKVSTMAPSTVGDAGSVSVALASERALSVWRESASLGTAISTNGGATWQSLKWNAANDWMSPAVAISAEAGVVVGRSAEGIVACPLSAMNEWEKPVVIGPDRVAMEPRVAVSGMRVVAAWITSSAVYVADSTDGGKTWGTAQRLQGDAKSLSGASVALVGNQAVVVWRQQDAGVNRIFASVSSDGGRKWSTASPVEIGFGNAWGATVAIVEDKIVVFWKQREERLNTPFGCYSDDGGKTWSPSRAMTTGFGTDAIPQMAIDGERVLGAYLSSDGAVWTISSNEGVMDFNFIK